MLKIALIGAPTSYKTELAQQIKQALKGRKVAVVDGYIQDIEHRSNVVLSHYATYLGNIQAAVGRFEAERFAESSKPDVVITCGTLVETAVYTATLAHITNQSAQGDTNYRIVNDTRASLTMSWIGVLKNDLWEYDLVYYLPLEGGADRWNQVVDQHIPEAASTMEVDYTELPADRSKRVGIILQEILALETTPSDESTSGDSNGESEAGRVGPGHMPDLPKQTG